MRNFNCLILNTIEYALELKQFFFYLQLFIDKDTLVSAVTQSHDIHLLKIDNREDDMFTKIRGWNIKTIDDIHAAEEVQRNRKRVLEITNLIDHLRDELENLDLKNAE